MASRVAGKIKLQSVDELLGVPEIAGTQEIEIERIHAFPNHPFKVLDDEKMDTLVDSIRENGILNPVIVRPDQSGNYEMISGHRRLHAAKIVGLKKVPAIVKEMSDDEAIIKMVDANIQREEILPSEKAFAYKMKLDALKRTAGRPTKENACHNGTHLRSDQELALQVGDSARSIQRYIRLASATMVIADGLDRAPAIDVSALMDYENMKEKLSVEVISADANADLLANVPHDRMEDLAVVYRFVMESSEDGRASILVTNNLMDRMGVSHEQLRSDALENSPEIRPVVIMGMNEVMKEMMGPEVYEMFGIPDDAEETMYVATVPDKNSGAGVIAYQDFMDQAAERVGGDFFVLPSSINEILLVPDNGDMTADALRDMVKDVNAKEVSPEERLSDNVYHYDSKDHVFELAEKFEARQQEKKTEIDEKAEEKGSVLKDLKDKQKEAAAKPPVKDAAEKAAKSKGREVL